MPSKLRIRAFAVLVFLALGLSLVGFRLHWLESPQGKELLSQGFVDRKMLGLMNRLLAEGVFRVDETGQVTVLPERLNRQLSSAALRDRVKRYAKAAWLRPGAKGFDPRLFKVSPPQRRAGETLLLKGRILDRQGRVLAYSELLPQGLSQKRRYPLGGAASQVLGFSHPVYGSLGLEAALARSLKQPLGRQAALAGRTAKLRYGGEVRLTLDARLQRIAHQALAGKKGAVVLLDVATGGILAAAGSPSFDPNQSDRRAWLEARRPQGGKGPLLPLAWGKLYPPGSTFKLVVAAAWLEAHLADGKQPPVRYCGKKDYELNISDIKAQGKMDLHNALVKSCNIYFAHLGVDLGPKVRDMAVRLGFNQGLDLLPQLKDSSILAEPSLAYASYRYRKQAGPRGQAVSRELVPFKTFQRDYKIAAQCAIGQNLIAATPLQMAMVAQAVANRGELMLPHLVSQIPDPARPGRELELAPLSAGRVMSPRTAEFLRRAMVDVVQRGTGRRVAQALAMPLGFDIAGKTGSAETGDKKAKTHAWFVGFAPARDPKIAIAVVIENGGLGGRVAAPLAGIILQEALESEKPLEMAGWGQGAKS